MDVVEAGLMGLRSAVCVLTRRSAPLRFTLYPMIHLGEASFYAEVSRRLREHDLIVAEGGRPGSSSRPSRVAARLGLVGQSYEMVEVGVPIVWPDMPGDEFDRKWRQLPFLERAMIPLSALYLRTFATREHLARHLVTNDDTDIDQFDPTSATDRLINDERDALLTQAITNLHTTHHNDHLNIAIVYGAAHIPTLITHLMSTLDYVVTSAEWLTVFDY
ncbi:hypothetical protein [Actinocrispum sp. NPDC049592]|uniref:hypothetical protein n=1 Tax=Actinocrispum sp. NPDC049592 TaxID=3154835 RepID=UPI0034498F1C